MAAASSKRGGGTRTGVKKREIKKDTSNHENLKQNNRSCPFDWGEEEDIVEKRRHVGANPLSLAGGGEKKSEKTEKLRKGL